MHRCTPAQHCKAVHLITRQAEKQSVFSLSVIPSTFSAILKVMRFVVMSHTKHRQIAKNSQSAKHNVPDDDSASLFPTSQDLFSVLLYT